MSIPHVVGASGESLSARGRTQCEVNINGKIFYQTFIVCEHLKRPIILGRDFSIQNCIGISWTKTNIHQLTQNNEVIAETAEYQTPSRASVSLKKNIKVPPTILKSPAEAPVHRKVLLEDKNIWPKTQEAFEKLCKKYDDIISKNNGDIGKTMLVEMEIDTRNHPPIASKPYTLPLKHYDWVQKEIETLERAGMIERSISPWASPVVIVPKKSAPGEPPRRRMCIDY